MLRFILTLTAALFGLLIVLVMGTAAARAQDSPTFGGQVTYPWSPGTQYKAFAGDFDGDGLMDIGLRHSIDGILFIKHGPSFTDQVSYRWAAGDQYQPFAGDFNGDGKADIGLRHTIDGVMFWRTGPTFNDQSSYAWASGDQYQPFAADFNGDGRADLGLRSISDGRFLIRLAPGFTEQRTFQWAGGAQYQAFAADFDADGTAEIGLRHSVDGLFFMRPGPDFTGQFSSPWSAGDQYQAFVGDANGDGKADIGLRLVPDGTFSILTQQPNPPQPPPDRDGDGVGPPLDCNDGDASIRPGAIDVADNAVDENCDGTDTINLDRDNDGASRPTDCNDNDARVRPGLPDKPGNGFDENCEGGDAPFPRIVTPVRYGFIAFTRSTRVTKLRVLDVPAGAVIELRCRGGKAGGCFRGVVRRTSPQGASAMNLLNHVRRYRFKVRAVLELRVLHARMIGKVVRFTMRDERQLPTSRTLCARPDATLQPRC
jgi:hypothetical protein